MPVKKPSNAVADAKAAAVRVALAGTLAEVHDLTFTGQPEAAIALATWW